MHLTDKKAPKLVMTCVQPKMKHQIYMLVNGNHEMYKRRRRPDPLEVQQMKSERREEDERRAKERLLLSREMEARERAEQLRLQMEDRFREMEKRMQKKEKEVRYFRDFAAYFLSLIISNIRHRRRMMNWRLRLPL